MRAAAWPRVLTLAFTLVGAALFVLSLTRPWWGMVMYAPQYPDGLITIAKLTELSGDVEELNSLNHYIGMMPLENAARVEKAMARYLVPAFAALALLGALVRKRWVAWLMRAPMLSFPVVFLADLQYWLWYAGNHLDPKAALSATIKGFTPVALGEGRIAQFRTLAWLEPGFWMAVAGVSAVLVAGILASRWPGGGGVGRALSVVPGGRDSAGGSAAGSGRTRSTAEAKPGAPRGAGPAR